MNAITVQISENGKRKQYDFREPSGGGVLPSALAPLLSSQVAVVLPGASSVLFRIFH